MKYLSAILLSFAIFVVSCKKEKDVWHGSTYETLSIAAAPFSMKEIQVPVFPNREFPITNYGAIPLPIDGSGFPTSLDSSRVIRVNAKAFENAMVDCCNSSGGHVVVPKGEWLTGAIKFQSNCDLFLSEGSVLVFSGKPDDYVLDENGSWEGIECFNYCPLILARQCSNISISGTGTLKPIMTEWIKWYEPTPDFQKALQILDRWGSYGEKFFLRQISGYKYRLRPQLILFYKCNGILLQDFKVRESPHWAIHCFGCDQGVVRRLDVSAHGRRCDGVALEMSHSFVVEDCVFEQGGDAVSIKSGRVFETWNFPESSHDIIIRRCEAKRCKAFLSIGEEISHGVHNVYMYNCKASGEVDDLLSIRSNRRQGSEVFGITIERCEAGALQRILGIDTDVYGDWRNSSSAIKDSLCATIKGVDVHDVKCRRTVAVVDINGDDRNPVMDVIVKNVHVDSISSFVDHTINVKGYMVEDIDYSWLGHSSKQPIRPR